MTSEKPLKELLRTNDPVLITRIEAMLADWGIGIYVLDMHMSVLEGSLGILPRRVMVSPDDWNQARRALLDAGLANQLPASRA